MWYYTFWAGVIPLAGATLLSYGSLLTRRGTYQAATSAGPITLSAPVETPAWLPRLTALLTQFSAVFLLVTLALRTLATGHPPYSNMWEYLVSVATATVVVYTLMERRYHEPALALGVLPVALTAVVAAEWIFSSNVTPLMPALQNNRLLAIHVALMLISYSALAVAFGASVLFLVQGKRARIQRLPPQAVFDDLGHRAVLLAFPLLAAGIALGAYWGNIAWGRYWGWDPKETTALVTWLIFAAYLHTRSLVGWRGARGAWLVVVGFGCVIFNIFAVNFWIAGLHSYAGPR